MKRLHAGAGETVPLFVPTDTHRVSVEVLPSPHDLRMTFDVGASRLLHAGAAGKAMLAFMPAKDVRRVLAAPRLPRFTPDTVTSPRVLIRQLAEVHHRGFTISHGEARPGAAAIVAPVFHQEEALIGALKLLGPRSRMTEGVIRGLAPAVVSAAQAISKDLGSRSNEIAQRLSERRGSRTPERRRLHPPPSR